MNKKFSFILSTVLFIIAFFVAFTLLNKQNAWIGITLYWLINTIKLGIEVFNN